MLYASIDNDWLSKIVTVILFTDNFATITVALQIVTVNSYKCLSRNWV